MNITQDHFNVILQRYLKYKQLGEDDESVRAQYSAALRKAIEFLELTIHESLLNLRALGSSNRKSQEEQQAKFALLCHFLDEAISPSDAPSGACSFLEKEALASKAMLLDRHLTVLTHVDIYSDPRNLSLREKYVKGILTKTHWLTDLDLMRIIEILGLKATIGVAPFNAPSLGTSLHFSRLEHEGANEPYTIPFLLNCGSEDGGQGTHWISAIITVNPLTQRIQYKIQDSLSLSPGKRQFYENQIRDALGFYDESHSAFPGYTIEENSAIVGLEEQRDSFSCGYRALDSLLQVEVIRGQGNAKAQAYGVEPVAASDDLVRRFYQYQLENFELPFDVYQVLSVSAQRGYQLLGTALRPVVRISREVLIRFIETLSQAPLLLQAEPGNSTSIEEFIGGYKNESVMSFTPKIHEHCDAIQYDSLLKQLFQLQIKSKFPPLRHFILAKVDIKTLEGLNAFYAETPVTLFKRITLTIDKTQSTDPKILLIRLKGVVGNLSHTQLEQLSIEDDSVLTVLQIQDLIDFVRKHKIGFTIDLPKQFQSSPYQRELDLLTALNRRDKNGLLLATQHQQILVQKPQILQKRTRIQPSGAESQISLNVDVELEQQHQNQFGVDQEIQVQRDKIHSGGGNTYQALDIIYHDAIVSGNFVGFKDCVLGLKKEELALLWHEFCGNVLISAEQLLKYKRFLLDGDDDEGNYLHRNHELSGMTAQAFERLARHRDSVSGGINIRQLPQGFILIPNGKGSESFILHFDSQVKQSVQVFAPDLRPTNTSPFLSIDLVSTLIDKLPPDLFYVALWKQLSDPYSRKESGLLRKHILQLVQLSDAQLAQLHHLCTQDGVFNYDRLDFIFTHIDRAKQMHPYDSASFVGIAWLESQFQTTEECQAYCSLAADIAQSMIKPFLQHPIFNLLDKETQESILSYNLDTNQLNQILYLYDKYGDAGVKKLIKTWEQIKDIPNIEFDKLPSILIDVENYEEIIKSDELLKAVTQISQFSDTTRQWWDLLYAKHHPLSDNLVTLVSQFTSFIKALESRNLILYDLSDQREAFKSASNLPTTLGRMISILDLCRPEDIQEQWAVMSQISLDGSEALRAFTDGKRKGNRPCAFVVPEMGIERSSLIENGYDAQQHHPDSSAIEKNRLESFFRCVAYQKSAMPVEFYKRAIKQIEDARRSGAIPSKAADILYVILADATTGLNYLYFEHDPAALELIWSNIVSAIGKISIPMVSTQVKVELVEILDGLPTTPALSLLEKLVKMLTKPFLGLGPLGIKRAIESAKKLDLTRERLTDLLRSWINKIYIGMKFYGGADFESVDADGKNLLDRYLDICDAISRRLYEPDVIPLISAFRLSVEDIGPVCDALDKLKEVQDDDEPLLKKNLKKYLVKYALSFLPEMQSNENLTADDLIGFITSLQDVVNRACDEFCKLKIYYAARDEDKDNELDEAFLEEVKTLNTLTQIFENSDPSNMLNRNGTRALFIAYFKKTIAGAVEANEKLGPQFPQDYFSRLNAGETRKSISIQIDALFKESKYKELVCVIINRFVNASEEQQFDIVSDLATLCQGLNSSEKDELLGLLRDPRLTGISAEQYHDLLVCIETSGIRNFVYFMHRALELKVHVADLTVKLQYFLAEALPDIHARRNPVLSELEADDLALDLILSAKKGELEAQYSVKQVYAELLELIQEECDDDAKAKQITAVLYKNKDLLDIDEVKALYHHLDLYLKKETTEIFVVRSRTISRAMEAPTSFISRLLKQRPQYETVEEIFNEATQKLKVECLDKEFLESALQAIQKKIQELSTYAHVQRTSIALIEPMIAHYPSAKAILLSFTQHYLMNSPMGSATQVEYSLSSIQRMQEVFLMLDDPDLVISLCTHFSSHVKEPRELGFDEFLALINGGTSMRLDSDPISFDNFPRLAEGEQKLILKIITSLLNNKKSCSLADIKKLIDWCHDDPEKVPILEQLFKNAPYPTIDLVDQWLSTGEDNASILQKYTQWNKHPVLREKECNGFDLKVARDQVNQMHGVTCLDEELLAISQAVYEVRSLDTVDLIKQIDAFKTSEVKDYAKLVALMAELLYRSKGLPARDENGVREFGRSFEINTTQYLALYSMLKSGGHVTSQIATGEGKSRIMMLAAGCQFALGKTVDFVTSDLSLATRDYLEYQSFFKVIGAQTNLIYANMGAHEYRHPGINFSDAANLNLFRNKARSEGNGAYVIAENPADRCLLLDEADKTYFDASDTRYNYSAPADKVIQDMPWVYELMVRFLSIPENLSLYYCDADTCNEEFIKFAVAVDERYKSRLVFDPQVQNSVISRSQLEAWQAAAINALSLKVDEHFTIKENVRTKTRLGLETVSQAQFVSGGNADAHSKLSFGVHQCLHARLNLLRKGVIPSHDPQLSTAVLEQLQHPFYVDSENQIIYSSTSKALVDDYSEGVLLAVTGTMGAAQERVEASVLYGGKDGTPMRFIDIPRHNKSQRKDSPVAITENEAEQRQCILNAVLKSLDKNQPILLVCENDAESRFLLEYLKEHLNEDQKRKLVRISAQTALGDEADHIANKAGQPGAITISTVKLGRGTDIKLHNEAKVHGLNVIAIYLPRMRDYLQIIGRAARFGEPGESHLILDKTRVQRQIKGGVLSSAIYTATESYLYYVQKGMDADAQKQRIVKNSVNSVRLQCTHLFFKDLLEGHMGQGNNKEEFHAVWRVFFDKTDKLWNEIWPQVAQKLLDTPCDLNELLKEYESAFLFEWKALKSVLKDKINQGKIVGLSEDRVEKLLEDQSIVFKISQEEQRILDAGAPIPDGRTLRTIVAKEDHPHYRGRAVTHAKIGDGIKSWLQNLFSTSPTRLPNWHAYKEGHMSFWRLLGGVAGHKKPGPAVGALGVPGEEDTFEETYARIMGKQFDSHVTLGDAGVSASDRVNEDDPEDPRAAKMDTPRLDNDGATEEQEISSQTDLRSS